MSKIKDLYRKGLFYLSVPKCTSCGRRLDISELALCNECLESYREALTDKCSVCGKYLAECTCVNEYLDAHYIHKLFKLFRYKYSDDTDKRAANELIYVLKRNPRRDIVDFLTDELCRVIKSSGIKTDGFVITSVPRSKGRIIKYGHDHAEMLAKSLAKKLEIKYVKVLTSKAKHAQKKVGGSGRISNAKFDYRLFARVLDGKKVFLLDDIVTTGASLGSCAMLLRGIGASKIVGITLAITFRDKYKPFLINNR